MTPREENRAGNYFKIQHSVSPPSGEKGGLRRSSVFLCCKQLYGTNQKKEWSEKLDNNGLWRLAGALCCRLHILHSMYIQLMLITNLLVACFSIKITGWLIKYFSIFIVLLLDQFCPNDALVFGQCSANDTIWEHANFIGREIGRLIYLFQENITIIFLLLAKSI